LTLSAPFIAVTVACILGIPAGLASGYFGKKIDVGLGRTADAFMCFPPTVFAIAVIAMLGPGLVNAMVAVGVIYAPRLFRVVRGASLSVREMSFIEAAHASGCRPFRTLRVHVFPNLASVLLVQVSLLMGFAILAESGLSFLGLGVQPPDASWGVMLRHAFDNKYLAPAQIYPPGAAIALVVLAFNFLGDGLRDSVGRDVRGSR
jgi:peptide/nickel transport system permease protein